MFDFQRSAGIKIALLILTSSPTTVTVLWPYTYRSFSLAAHPVTEKPNQVLFSVIQMFLVLICQYFPFNWDHMSYSSRWCVFHQLYHWFSVHHGGWQLLVWYLQWLCSYSLFATHCTGRNYCCLLCLWDKKVRNLGTSLSYYHTSLP